MTLGAVVSTGALFEVNEPELVPTLPAASDPLTSMVCVPSASVVVSRDAVHVDPAELVMATQAPPSIL